MEACAGLDEVNPDGPGLRMARPANYFDCAIAWVVSYLPLAKVTTTRLIEDVRLQADARTESDTTKKKTITSRPMDPKGSGLEDLLLKLIG